MCKYRTFIQQVLRHDWIDVNLISNAIESSWQNLC